MTLLRSADSFEDIILNERNGKCLKFFGSTFVEDGLNIKI